MEQETIDAGAISQDIRQLVSTGAGLAALIGLWIIWSDVLPALSILRHVELWHHLTDRIETVVGPDGSAQTRTVRVDVPITLADLGLALGVLLITFQAYRRIPALLEFTILQRLRLLPGERYAICALSRYAITIVGVVLAFHMIGIGWSQVQWLAAGITVGLGFGLQEIFANFVSGLTLLFERPIRVGDWVTVGDIEGVVTKIRIRATTIVDRDRKELVVPNREFVTGRLINWTLTDPITRVIVRVGIAYGSDVDLATRELLAAAAETEHVVEEPAARALFLGFGESSLDFELRVFVTGRDVVPRVTDELHRRIDRRFRRAGIEISFPQRDLHLRDVPPALVRGSAAPDAPVGEA